MLNVQWTRIGKSHHRRT